MQQYTRIILGRKAKELGFVRDTLEKVMRLTSVLRFIETDRILRSSLALKGGTAINLFIFSLPRLSVDIDLDFVGNVSRNEMLEKRESITTALKKYMTGQGYTLSEKSKSYHALDSFVFAYQNSGGTKDNIKVEVNYMLRAHVLPISGLKAVLPWDDIEIRAVLVNPIEIYASKIVALLDRTAPRDLYDVYTMQKAALFTKKEEALLRKCIVFYSAIGTGNTATPFEIKALEALQAYKIKTDLIPVLRQAEKFALITAQTETKNYLSKILKITKNEKNFLETFEEKKYSPELLFRDKDILRRISRHPMALWKCGT